MNPQDDIEELEGPFEQIAGATAAAGSNGSDSPPALTITVSPNKTFCKGTVQVTASSTKLFEVVTITFPDGSTKSGASPYIVTYTAKEDDCGKNVTFSATGGSSTSASTNIDVIKVEFQSLHTDAADTFYVDDENDPNGKHRLGVLVDITAKVMLTPKQNVVPSNLKFRMDQWVNGHVGWIYALDNSPLDTTQQKIGEDEPPNLGRAEPDSYVADTGVLTMVFTDTPGRAIAKVNEHSYGSVRADFKAADYLQMKTDSGNWQTIGKLEWHWMGGVGLNPDTGDDGGVPEATGSQNSDTPRTPANP